MGACPKARDGQKFNISGASQFENHWRAILGLPLYDPARAPSPSFFTMLNLLGPEKVDLRTAAPPLPVPGRSAFLHWYGKSEIRPGRKLGHLNGCAATVDDLDELTQELLECEKNWIETLK